MLAVNLIKIVEFLFRNIPNKFNVNQIARELKISAESISDFDTKASRSPP